MSNAFSFDKKKKKSNITILIMTIGTPSPEVRQEFPFIRPPLLIWYAIPAVGALIYLRNLNRIKETLAQKPSRRFNLKEWLTLGTSKWPRSKNSKEFTEATITALQNSLIMAYHTATTFVIIAEVLKIMQP